MAARDPELLPFRISTGLKNIIGKELITHDNIAFFELVKNSYDADATSVKIVFLNIKKLDKRESRILIIDEGNGMSREDIIDKWLFVGYSEKKLPSSPTLEDFRNKITKRKRIFAGAKGIGRFSADRLGKKLQLYTKKKGETVFQQLSVNWAEFEDNQTEIFQTILVPLMTTKHVTIRDYEHEISKQGTILEISELNEEWNEDKLLDLKRYLQRLINPSHDRRKDFEIFVEAKEFLDRDRGKGEYESINGPVRNVVFEKLNVNTAHIECRIDKRNLRTTLFDKGKKVFSLREDNTYSELNNIYAKIFFLNPAAKRAFTSTMGIEAAHFGSVFLYRNGFRVNPYGNEGDDWLGIDRRKAQGYARNLGSRELLGRIEVNDFQPFFQEVSSRSGGVIETKAHKQLCDMLFEKLLKRLEKYVVEGINWDTEKAANANTSDEIKVNSLSIIESITGQVKDPKKDLSFDPQLLDIFKSRQMENLDQVVKNVETITQYVKSSAERKYINRQLAAFKATLRVVRNRGKENERELEIRRRESLFLRKAVSNDKQIVMNLNHTIKNSTLVIKNLISEINQKIRAGEAITDIAPLIDRIGLENQKVSALAGIVSVANFNLKVKWISKDLVAFISEYIRNVLGTKPNQMKFELRSEASSYVARFRPLEISIMIDNFISNARKADANRMVFSFNVKGSQLSIRVSDNGIGVSERSARYLFTRGFTTTDGSGIGLYYVKSIVESMGGRINFIGNRVPGLERGACFEVIIK